MRRTKKCWFRCLGAIIAFSLPSTTGEFEKKNIMCSSKVDDMAARAHRSSMKNMLISLLFIAVIISSFPLSATQSCANDTFSNNQPYESCASRPRLGATLHYNYTADTNTVSMAFHTPLDRGRWVTEHLGNKEMVVYMMVCCLGRGVAAGELGGGRHAHGAPHTVDNILSTDTDDFSK
jgi:hypothetical protein